MLARVRESRGRLEGLDWEWEWVRKGGGGGGVAQTEEEAARRAVRGPGVCGQYQRSGRTKGLTVHSGSW